MWDDKRHPFFLSGHFTNKLPSLSIVLFSSVNDFLIILQNNNQTLLVVVSDNILGKINRFFLTEKNADSFKRENK